jgi:hypothetical protein
MHESGVWQLHGLLSREGECQLNPHPDVFASVAAAKDWIEQVRFHESPGADFSKPFFRIFRGKIRRIIILGKFSGKDAESSLFVHSIGVNIFPGKSVIFCRNSC